MPQCDLNAAGVVAEVALRPQAARRSVDGRDIKSLGESSPRLNTFLRPATDWHMIHLQ